MPTPDPFGDEHRSPMMDPHHLNSYNNRTPSPGRPLDSYQLHDNPYGQQGHLPMPSSDRLAEQPTVSCAVSMCASIEHHTDEPAQPFSTLSRTFTTPTDTTKLTKDALVHSPMAITKITQLTPKPTMTHTIHNPTSRRTHLMMIMT
jgi:hypothetical protein